MMDRERVPVELGRWLAKGRTGAVRLRWSSGELTLRLADCRVVGLEGLDAGCVANELGYDLTAGAVDGEAAESGDILVEACRVAERAGIAQTRVLTAVKACLEPALRAWMIDAEAEIDTFESEVELPEGPAISLPHVLVETVLADDDPALVRVVLPSRDVLLRRADGFLPRYASLELDEEADLVAAKVTGQRTADEIVSRSPQSPEEVERLLAALVVAGLMEMVPVVREVVDTPLIGEPVSDEGEPRTVPWRWIGFGLAAVILIIVVLAIVVGRGETGDAAASGSWGIVVDMGCEAVEYERMLRKVDRYDENLRAVKVPTGQENETPCWRLIWGAFSSEEQAEDALSSLPETLVAGGFEPHVIALRSRSDPVEDAS